MISQLFVLLKPRVAVLLLLKDGLELYTFSVSEST